MSETDKQVPGVLRRCSGPLVSYEVPGEFRESNPTLASQMIHRTHGEGGTQPDRRPLPRHRRIHHPVDQDEAAWHPATSCTDAA